MNQIDLTNRRDDGYLQRTYRSSHVIRNPSPSQRRNTTRRTVAALKQKPLHMSGLAPHPLLGTLVSGQLDRAAGRKREYQRQYPYAPKYKNHDGTDATPSGN